MKDLKAKFEEVKSERDQLHSDLESRTNELEKIRTDLIDADAKVSVVHISMKMTHVILMIHLYESPIIKNAGWLIHFDFVSRIYQIRIYLHFVVFVLFTNVILMLDLN